MELNECRKEIDKINDEILQLFLRRMELSRHVAKYKVDHGMPISDPERECEILSQMAKKADPEFENYVKTLYSVIMELSRSYQSSLLDK